MNGYSFRTLNKRMGMGFLLRAVDFCWTSNKVQ
jgi:hypothetical protein